MGDLVNRTRLGLSVDKAIADAFEKLAQETLIPKSRLADKALTLLLKEYGIKIEQQ